MKHQKILTTVQIDWWNMGRRFKITIANNTLLLTPKTNCIRNNNNIIYVLNDEKNKFINYFSKPILNNERIRTCLITSTGVKNCVHMIAMPQGVMYKWNVCTKEMNKMNVPIIRFNKMNRFRHMKISNITYDLKYYILHESFQNEHPKWISNVYILDLHKNIVKLSSLPGPCSTGTFDIVIEKMDTYEQELLVNGYIRNYCPFALPIPLIKIISINKLEEMVYFIDDKRSRYLQTNIRHILCLHL